MHIRGVLIALVSVIAVFAEGQSLNLITKENLTFWVQALSHDSMQGRFTGTVGNDKAAKFIADEFRLAGLKKVAGNSGYRDSITIVNGYDKLQTSNVVGAIAGETDQVIIFCAHYDHIGTITTASQNNLLQDNTPDPFNLDSIYNGANDNASGIAALLALASYYADTAKPSRTLLFAAFSGEELGLRGAYKIAYMFDKQKVVQVINLEMLGRGNAKTKQRPYITAQPGDRRLLKALNKNYEMAVGEKDFFVSDPFYDEHLFSRSDNMAFALHGIPANSIMAASPKDIYYHQLSDVWNTLDFDGMEKIVKAIALATAPIVFGNK